MPLNIDGLARGAREQYLTIGERFGSRDTLEQANKTLKALTTYGATLAAYGFTEPDRVALVDARDFLIAAGVDRETEKTNKKATNKALLDAEQAAKQARRRARAVLGSARRPLTDAGQDAAIAALDSTLEQTARSRGDTERLAQQLQLLRAALAAEAVAAVVAERGGPAAIAELELAVQSIRSARATSAGTRGTPAETERLDIADGVIVTLCRDARAASRAAAGALGRSAIAEAFELDELYKTGGRRKPTTPTA